MKEMQEIHAINKMNSSSLTGRLKRGLLTGLLASYIGLLGCGGGGGYSPQPPEPKPTPTYSQTANLVRDVDIEYGAKFANMNNPVRSITHDGVQFGNDLTLLASPYPETFDDLQKGSYVFTLKTTTPNVSPISLTREVPNYMPTADFSNLETTLNQRYEGSSIEVCVNDRLLDRNPEDRPVPLNNVISLDGKTIVNRTSDYCSTISTNGVGPYQLEFNFGSDSGGRGSGIIQGNIIEVPEQILSQAVSLFDYVDINYSATLTNVASATRTITHDGNPFDSPTIITTSPYNEFFDDMWKGNYSFKLETLGINPHIVSLDLPNYLPTADLNGLETKLNEGSSITISLGERFTDQNIEDLVSLVSAKTLTGDVETIISGSDLNINSVGAPGPYSVEVTYGSNEGGLAKSIIQGDVIGFMHIKGQLQDARTNTLGLKTNETGIIQVYNAADNTLLKEYLTDSQGNFDFELEQEVSEMFLQARIDLEIPLIGLTDGFVRTLRITPGADTTNILVRAYPYNEILSSAGVNKIDFKKHLEELNPYLFKSVAKNIEIIDVNPLGNGSFTPEFMNLVKNKILNPNDIGCYVDPLEMGKPLNVQLDDSNSIKHYSLEGTEIIPEQGWGIFVKDETLQGANTRTFSQYKFRISTRPETEAVAAHEFGHGFIAPWNHALTLLAGTQTIMRDNSELGRSTPGPADCEAAKVIYEKTYEVQRGGDIITIEPYSNTLGLGFCKDSAEFCPEK